MIFKDVTYAIVRTPSDPLTPLTLSAMARETI